MTKQHNIYTDINDKSDILSVSLIDRLIIFSLLYPKYQKIEFSKLFLETHKFKINAKNVVLDLKKIENDVHLSFFDELESPFKQIYYSSSIRLWEITFLIGSINSMLISCEVKKFQ